jgi:CBS domain-containing protein
LVLTWKYYFQNNGGDIMQSGSLQIAEFMTKKPVTIISGSTVSFASKVLNRYHIGSLLVLNENKELIGIFSARDIVYDVVAQEKDPKDVLVNDIMVSDIVTISPQKSIQDAMELMGANDIRQLPVVSNNELVGFITMKDILRVEPALADIALECYRNEEELRQEIIQEFAEHPERDIDKFV